MQSGESSQADDAGTVAGVEGAVSMQSSFSSRTVQVGAAVGQGIAPTHGETGREGKHDVRHLSVSDCKPSRHLVACSSAERFTYF